MASDNYSVKYAFTVTLKPNMYRHAAEKQYEDTYKSLFKNLEMLGKVTIVAEITKNYNIHYHGIIRFAMCFTKHTNLMKAFVDSFRTTKSYGFVNIKQIIDEPGWIDYISKSLPDTMESIKWRPIVIDQLDIFNESTRAKYANEW